MVSDMKRTVYLSLGSNKGNRKNNLLRAIGYLRAVGTVAAISPLYETEPVGVTLQRWFLNCTVALETALGPQPLLASTQQIERRLGRWRNACGSSIAKGSRPIDIDILLLGNTVLETSNLVIPHPAMHERRFVLEPLAEIAPNVRHPVLGMTVRQMRDAVQAERQAIRRMHDLSLETKIHRRNV
jgi:2-amino-4-hydroxy-6-hydroxymethyldihydropteridine diphosphokinase